MSPKLKRYFFLASALVGAIFLFLFSRRGTTIKDLKDQLVVNQIGAELAKITEQSKKSDTDYEAAKRRYDELKRAYPEYFKSGPPTGTP